MFSLYLSLCLVGIARATVLEDAVGQYNLKASLVEYVWDDFQTKQSTAFLDMKGWLDGLYGYFSQAGLDDEAADEAWEAAEIAMEHLQTTSGQPADTAYTTLVLALEDAVTALQAVQAADLADTGAKAYSYGPLWFDVPSLPVPCWDDPEYPDFDTWMEFEFPHLYVGDNTHTSYVSLLSTGFLEWLESIEWLHLGAWIIEHEGDGRQYQRDAKCQLDEMCAACYGNGIPWVTDWCFTTELLDDWCEEQKKSDDPECEKNYCDSDANTYLTGKFGCWRQIQVGKVAETAQSYIQSSWLSEFEWLQ